MRRACLRMTNAGALTTGGSQPVKRLPSNGSSHSMTGTLIVRDGVERERDRADEPLRLNGWHFRFAVGRIPPRVRFKPERSVRIEDDLDHVGIVERGQHGGPSSRRSRSSSRVD